MESIPLSEFPSNTYVFLNNKTRDRLFNKLEKKYGYLSRAKKIINSGDLYYWKVGFQIRNGKKIKRYIPLPVLKRICGEVNVDINTIQKDIIELKTSSRSGVIKNPKIPLKIVPETFAVLGHLLGDGYGGERGHACYVNKSKEALYNFIDKLKKAFGNVQYSINLKHDRVIISKIVPRILKNYFKIEDFRSRKSEITSLIFKAPREYLVEFVKAIIIDEGRIGDSGIWIEFVANPKLTKDFQKICNRVGYTSYSSKGCIILRAENFPKIKEDMKEMIVPHKQKMFLKWFNKKSRKWYNRYKGSTKKEIVEILMKNSMSSQELSFKINVDYDSIRTQIKGYPRNGKHMDGLIDLGIVEVKSKGWRDTAIFGIKDNQKTLNFLNN